MTDTAAPNTAHAAAKRARPVSFTPMQYWVSVGVLLVSVAAALVAFVLVGGRHIGVCPGETQTSRPGNSTCYPISFHESRLQ